MTFAKSLASPLALTLAALSLAVPASALAMGSPTADRFRATVEFLADDKLEGREAGTKGYDAAADYVAAQMKALGLQPGDLDGDYMQVIKFANHIINPNAPMALILGGERIAQGDGVALGRLPGFAGAAASPADIVFVSHGMYAPEYGIDAYGDMDMTGKVALVYGGLDEQTEKALPSDVRATLMSTVATTLAKRGAAGIISIIPERVAQRMPFETFAQSSLKPTLTSLMPDGSAVTDTGTMRIAATISPALAAKMLKNAPVNWSNIQSKTKRRVAIEPFAVGTTVAMERLLVSGEAFQSANVVGIIPGSDPELKNEVVALVGHLDHVGVHDGKEHKQGQRPSKGKDKIYNGAMDNATGIASMLEAARMFQESGKAPRRTIMFIGLTAEEKGLMGAEWLANNMQMFGDRKLVGLINLDMPIITSDFDRVVAYGAEHSTMGVAVEQAISAIGVKRVEDPMPDQVFFIRSDHYEFVKAGIPSIYLAPLAIEAEAAKMQQFLASHYHQPSDEPALIDYEAGAKFATVNYNIARTIADADASPAWYEDSFFGRHFAPEAAKAKR